jgi:putative glycerol-1-phosphate prenyltransferase
MNIYTKITSKKNQIAVLVDPEKINAQSNLRSFAKRLLNSHVDFIFIGGSSVTKEQFDLAVNTLKQSCDLPLVIFPGSSQQLSSHCDAILYLSLVSGRNPEYLIGQHIQSAFEVESLNIEVIPTAYILIDGGSQSAVAYVSQTTPIPATNFQILRKTALASKFQGKRLLYLDAGSGAKNCIAPKMIEEINNLGLPIIVGGGIRNTNQIKAAHEAGAQIVVIGNKLEENPEFLNEIKKYKEACNNIELKGRTS